MVLAAELAGVDELALRTARIGSLDHLRSGEVEEQELGRLATGDYQRLFTAAMGAVMPSRIFKLPCLLGPPIAHSAAVRYLLGGRALYTTQWTRGCPARPVASLPP